MTSYVINGIRVYIYHVSDSLSTKSITYASKCIGDLAIYPIKPLMFFVQLNRICVFNYSFTFHQIVTHLSIRSLEYSLFTLLYLHTKHRRRDKLTQDILIFKNNSSKRELVHTGERCSVKYHVLKMIRWQ